MSHPEPEIEGDLLVRRFGADSDPRSVVEPGLDAFFARTLSRGSCRDFRTQPIEDGLFDLIIATSLCAPSKSDLQQASIVEIASPAQRAAVAELAPDLAWLGTAPRLLVVCADAYRYEAMAKLHGIAIGNGDLEGFFNATVDAALVLQTLILAAEAVGLGSCPVSGLRHQATELSALLMLPKRVVPIAGLALGYPSNSTTIRPRLPRNLTIHRDRYAVGDLEGSIRAYDLLRAGSQAEHSSHAPSWSQERSMHRDPAKSDLFRAFVAAAGFSLSACEHDPE